MADIIDSFNIFVDSQQGLSGKGDDVSIQMGTAGLSLGDGEMYKMYLEQFSCYHDWYNVHGNNSLFRIHQLVFQ